MRIRVPLRYLTVFSVTALVTLAVGIVFFLGFISATKNTRLLMSDQAEVIINSMERDIALWLRPVDQQAKWVSKHVVDNAEAVSELQQFDSFMFGALAATTQVAGIALITPDGLIRRWIRASGKAITEDWSARKEINLWIKDSQQRFESEWIEPFFTDTIDKTILLHDLPIHAADGKLLAVLAQIVPIEELSSHVVNLSPREGMTPFILHGKDLVLAHPLLIKAAGNAGGTAFSLSYTVYGDSVNLAARLERLNKEFGTQLLVSENTAMLDGNLDILRAVGETSIRGQAGMTKIYTHKHES